MRYYWYKDDPYFHNIPQQLSSGEAGTHTGQAASQAVQVRGQADTETVSGGPEGC